MKRWLWLALLLLPCAMHAQVVGPGFINYVTSAPSGACSQGEQMRVVIGLGTVYTCQNGTWAPVGGGGGSGTVTGVLGTTNQINSDGSATTPTLSLSSTLIFPGTVTVSANGALSASAINFTGTPITGGTATTTFPLFYFNQGAAVSSFSTAGTELGMNAPSGFTGNFLDFHVNGGATQFTVGSGGAVTANGLATVNGLTLSNGNVNLAAATLVTWSGRSRIVVPADGVVQITNNAQTGFTRLDLGLTTSSGPAFGVSGTTITAQLGDGTAGGIFAASKYATVSPCSNGASPAVCSAASSGTVAVPTGTNPTLVINTTAITASSQVFLQIDESATISATTCNTTLSTLVQPVVTARTAATSFTIQIGAIIATNPACVHYSIVN